ncbi:MAG: phosphatase PAP2 family protein [Rhizobiales bacterium]|nr:phosphatase PAP2 family protein [Hyphomicrobiales bacterium]
MFLSKIPGCVGGVLTVLFRDFGLLIKGKDRNSDVVLLPKLGWQLLLVLLSLAAFWLALVLYVDVPITRWTKTLDPELRGLARQLTDLGKSDLYIAVSAIIIISMIVVRIRSKTADVLRQARQINAFAAYWLVCIAGSGLLVMVVKQLIGRARPKHLEAYGHLFFDPLTFDASFAGFPSGHATTSFALVAIVSTLMPRLMPIAFITGASLAFTRVIVGAHYFSDVVFAGILALVFCLFIRRVFAKRGWLFEPFPDGKFMVKSSFLSALSNLVSRSKTTGQ